MSEELKNQIALITKNADTIVVTNESEFIAASEYLKANKKMQKNVSALLDPGIKKANEAHKFSTKHKNDLLAPLLTVARQVGAVIGAYLNKKEQERLEIQRQEQKLLQQVADKKAELLKNLGCEVEAKMAKDEPTIAPIKIKKVIPKTGVSIKRTFDFEIIDATKIKGEFMVPDEAKIRALVKSLGKNAESYIGGIRVFDKIITSTRC